MIVFFIYPYLFWVVAEKIPQNDSKHTTIEVMTSFHGLNKMGLSGFDYSP